MKASIVLRFGKADLAATGPALIGQDAEGVVLLPGPDGTVEAVVMSEEQSLPAAVTATRELLEAVLGCDVVWLSAEMLRYETVAGRPCMALTTWTPAI